MKKMRFLTGLAAGYVLGTRAGRSQYDKITAKVNELLDHEMVAQVRDEVTTRVAGLTGGSGSTADLDAGSGTIVTPPVIVGAGPAGASGDELAADIVMPDLEPSTAKSAPKRTAKGSGTAKD